MPYNEFISRDEKHTLNRLIKYAEDHGWTVSLFDGEEWTAKRIEPKDLPPYVATTGQDLLLFRDAQNEIVGKMVLIYGNSGEELIADLSANEPMLLASNYAIARWSKYR